MSERDRLLRKGTAQRQAGNLDAAIEAFRRLTLEEPDFPDGYTCLGNALKAKGQFVEAVEAHVKGLRLAPESAAVWSDLASTYLVWCKPEAAAEGFRQAAKLAPDVAHLHYNLGTALQSSGLYEDALQSLRRATELDPSHSLAYSNLGTTLKALGRWAEALAALRRSTALDPSNADAQWNLSLTLIAMGQSEEGWRLYEWRRKIPTIPVQRFEEPDWDGSVQATKTLLLHAEQGLGDTLQFVRFAKRARERVGSIILQCHPPLVDLLTGMDSVDRIVARGQDLPDFDVHAPLMSLPHLLGISAAELSAAVPYLRAQPEAVKRVEELIPSGKLRVGISWQGNPGYQMDRHRSIPLSAFRPLATVDGLQLISLQKKHGLEQIPEVTFSEKLHDLGSRLDEETGAFVETSAVISKLDMVVCSDSSVAHLAAALGAKVWLLLPEPADWRWGIEGDSTPWYDNVRLFRQRTPGDWNEVLSEVAKEIATT